MEAACIWNGAANKWGGINNKCYTAKYCLATLPFPQVLATTVQYDSNHTTGTSGTGLAPGFCFIVFTALYLCSHPCNTFNGRRWVAQLVITQFHGRAWETWLYPDAHSCATTSLTGSHTIDTWVNTSADSISLFCHWSAREAARSTTLLHSLFRQEKPF